MKLNFDIKNKKANLEADVERLVEKGMDQNEKNWKDKFVTKHNAKKEILEIKHKQKMEMEEKSQTKKNWIQKIEEERRRTKQLEFEEQKRIDEENKKNKKNKIILSIILGILGATLMIVGCVLGSLSGDPDSGWYMMTFVGLFVIISIVFIWANVGDNKKR